MDLTVCYFPRRQTTWLKWKIKGTQVNEIHRPNNLGSFNGKNDHYWLIIRKKIDILA
jgi:hypothetical protein